MHVIYYNWNIELFVGAANTKTVKCFRATFGANPSFAVDKFAFLDSVPTTSQSHLPVKLTIDKSFRENLRSSKTLNSSAVGLPPRPSTPSQNYEKFAEELQRSCMSTPGNKFDDSGWVSNSNSVGSFGTDSTFCGTDEAGYWLDVETVSHAPPSFEGVTLTGPLFILSSGNTSNESSVSSEPDVSVSMATTDENDSADCLLEWSLGDLPSNWQAVTANLEHDNRLSPLAFDRFYDVDVTAVDIDDVVCNGSGEVNIGSDYIPEVNELLAFVGD